nr:reverse transcriptase domain-containing protein [Tanacetum cinerariifolium]GEV38578.1 reverse transcriptase domain-containing protein [Tanacetum cinerariifolium]
MGDFRNQQRSERRRDKFTLLTKSPKDILALDKSKFKVPSPIGKDQPKVAKKGEASEKDKVLATLMVQSWQKAPSTGKMSNGSDHRTLHRFQRRNHMANRTNITIGRPGVRKIQPVLTAAHGMLKFPVPGGILTLRSSKIIPLKCTMVLGLKAQPFANARVAKDRIKVAIHSEYLEQTVAIGFDCANMGMIRNRFIEGPQRGCRALRGEFPYWGDLRTGEEGTSSSPPVECNFYAWRVDGELNFLPAKDVSEGRNSSSAKSVNNDA